MDEKGDIMNFYPRNRHVLVQKLEEKEEKQTTIQVLLPEGYSEKKEPYVSVLVKEVAPSCTIGLSKGDKVVVEASMLQEIKFDEELYIVILENYIYGVISSR